MDSSRYPELGYTPCEDGFAAAIPGDKNNTFRCNNVGGLVVDELYEADKSRLTCITSCLTHSSAV